MAHRLAPLLGAVACSQHYVAPERIGPAEMASAEVLDPSIGDRIPARQAGEHVGTAGTVCGQVASARYADVSRGGPSFLNLEEAFPNHVFTVVVWRESWEAFKGPPLEVYDGRYLCVTGDIESYRGIPQIDVDSPIQIEIMR